MSEKGFTMVEVLICAGFAVLLIGSSMAAFLGAGVTGSMAKHRMEALQVVRGKMEETKITLLASIVDSTSTVSYDPGPDGAFGNGDDLQGTLGVSVRDWLDMDADGNTTETSIDINGGGNDPSVVKPVRVTFTWQEYILGMTKSLSVSVDTLVAG